MSAILTKLIARINLERVRRVVGTLVRSTERDIIRAGMAQQAERGRVRTVDIGLPVRGSMNPGSLAGSTSGWLPGEWTSILKRPPRDLATQDVILGEGARYLTAALGTTPVAARKRLQRARDRLRAELATAS